MREKLNNDSMSPPRAMTLQGAGGHAGPAAAGSALCAPPYTSTLYSLQKFTLIRLFLQYLAIWNADASLPRSRANSYFSKRPLVKLKAVYNVISRTRTLCCDVNSLLVKTIVQLFVVAKSGCRVVMGRRARALLLLWLSGCGYSEGRRDNDLHIGGIFPMEGEGGWQGGQACMPAAELALADVNNRTDLLSGFKLMLHSNDSKVSELHIPSTDDRLLGSRTEFFFCYCQGHSSLSV